MTEHGTAVRKDEDVLTVPKTNADGTPVLEVVKDAAPVTPVQAEPVKVATPA